ncbi:MAG: glycosyltransferase family 2 protein, partial [Anaerolineales bacterium]|nr:glycosyltransferase family 2 protein [Anaerolineales bacterium]
MNQSVLPALSVVVPVFNEGEAVNRTLSQLKEFSQQHHWEVIVVDDGSTDDTVLQILQYTAEPYLRLVQHGYNRGYGAALKTGIRQATADFVATMDSDGQHDPNELLKLLPCCQDNDLVVGQRTQLVHSQLWRMPGKWFLGWLANYLTRQSIPDLNSGMRLFRRPVILKYLHLCSDRFSFSTTSTLVFFNRGYRVAYVPIQVYPRQGKSTVKVSTGLETIILILRIMTLFEPLRIFVPTSFVLCLLGILWAVPYAVQARGISVGALLLFCDR